MEYSPNCAIPYVARVDAGTIELVKKTGVEVVSSGDLVQRFAAVWDDRAIETHRAAADKLYRIKDRAFEEIRRRVADGTATTEYDIQQKMVAWFAEEGLVSDSPPNVSAAENAGNPHYLADRERSSTRFGPTSSSCWTSGASSSSLARCLLTSPGWGLRAARARPARESLRGGRPRPGTPPSAWSSGRSSAGQELRGWQVDRAASAVLRSAGYGGSDSAPHRPQSGRECSWQRREYGRLRDTR